MFEMQKKKKAKDQLEIAYKENDLRLRQIRRFLNILALIWLSPSD